MALVNTTSLTGSVAEEMYMRIAYGMPTLEGTIGFRAESKAGGHVMIMPNVKSKVYVPYIETTSGLKAFSCTFSADGDITISDKEIEPCRLAIQKDVCKPDFDALYNAEGIFAQPPGALNSTMQAEIINYFLEEQGGRVSEHGELLLWQGDTGAIVDGPDGEDLTLCDGFLKLMLADGTVIDVSAATTLDVSNIKDEVERMLLETNPRVIAWHDRTGEGRIFVSPLTELLLRLAIGKDYVNIPLLHEEDGILVYMGWPIVKTYGVPNDVMVLSYKRNLWVATDIVDDFKRIDIIDMQQSTGDRKLRFIGEMKLGVNYFRGDYVTLYDGR